MKGLKMGYVYTTPLMTYANSGESTISAGTGIVASKTFGVAITDIAAGDSGTLALSGVWDLPIGSATTASQGDLAYWDASNSCVTATASTNLQIGAFMAANTSGETTCRICVFNTGVQAVASGG